ncbi:GFA family protein [Bradyrhizobium yuanmingense]|nr:GFA family protein [Bradyrhizobium yuanmingense]
MRYGCVSDLREGVTMTESENSNARILVGECFCRAVRFEVADAFAYAMNCHCSNCRRTTGAAFKPFAGIRQDRLRIVKGCDLRMIFGDGTTHDAHCGRCGSLLYSRVREGEWVHVAMGTLVDAPSIRPSAHIFVGSKAPWHEITDDLPQYREHIGVV